MTGAKTLDAIHRAASSIYPHLLDFRKKNYVQVIPQTNISATSSSTATIAPTAGGGVAGGEE